MKELKSITPLRPCMLISISVFLMTIIIFMNSVVGDDEHKEIIQDLPEATDFDRYLRGLEMTVEFCIRHKHYVDINLKFGLFLIDVNLRQVLQHRGTSISVHTRSRLEKLFVKNDVVTKYFHHMVEKTQNVTEFGPSIKLTYLFYNATTWSKPVNKFNLHLLNATTIYRPEKMKEIYGRWEKYYKNVHNYETLKPSPDESNNLHIEEPKILRELNLLDASKGAGSDGYPALFFKATAGSIYKCIAYMVRSPPLQFYRRSHASCLTPPQCKQILRKASEFGYGLTHRILYMVIARFYRRCVVFSEREDKFMSDMDCRKCFGESQYIASNSFQLPDLLYEHIVLCGIFGHAQFLRNYWLKTLLQFQTSEGCFSQKIATGEFDETQLIDDENKTWIMERSSDIMNGQCNGHFTAVAAAALSHALRYIIETQERGN